MGDRHIKTPSYTQVSQRIYQRANQRWRRYAAHLDPWRARLDALAVQLGYPPD